MDLEAMARMGNNLYAADESLTVEFYNNAQLNEEKTAANGGVPVYEDKPYVRIYVPGDQYNVIDQPAWIDARHPNAHNKRFPKQWAAYLAGEKATTGGTPLSEFPALAESQRKTLAFINVSTVEQLAELADSHCQQVPAGNDLKRKAAAFLKARGDAAHTLKLDAEAQKLRAELQEMQVALAELKRGRAEAKPEAKSDAKK